ncbi:MAG: UDP-N-acetylmuramate dehydrogenase [Vampirovibrionales bacterium]
MALPVTSSLSSDTLPLSLDDMVFPNHAHPTHDIEGCQAQKCQAHTVTTYRCGGLLSRYYQPTSLSAWYHILTTLSEEERLSAHVLGWGSNTLIADTGLHAPCFDLRKLTQEQRLASTVIRFATGVHLARVAHVAAQTLFEPSTMLTNEPWGLSGLEGLVGIPGTVGGAVMMNAGAHSTEIAHTLMGVWLLEKRTLTPYYLPAHELQLSYRHNGYLAEHPAWILAADFALTPKPQTLIQRTTQHHQQWRKDHHPTEPNGGSVFRNPKTQTTLSVGAMVEALGLKGTRHGGAMISPKHGNFIVNIAQASTLDILHLMCLITTKVKEAYGVTLHPENKLFIETPSEEEKALKTILWGTSNLI